MYPADLTPNNVFEMIMAHVRAGLITEAEAANRLREVLARLDGLIARQANRETMTQLRALKLAQRAVEFYLSGEYLAKGAAINVFDLQEVDAAYSLLNQQEMVKHRMGLKRWPNRSALSTAAAVINWVRSDLDRYGRRSRRRKKRLYKNSLGVLYEAQAALPGLIAQLEESYTAYWDTFTAEALAEFEEIMGVEVEEDNK